MNEEKASVSELSEPVPGQFDRIDRNREMTSLKPGEVLAKLDLAAPGLEAAERASDAGDEELVFSALRDHYRRRFPLVPCPKGNRGPFEQADKVCRHILQWGPYEEADYGSDIDWTWDPRGDIECVAAMHRFYWEAELVRAYIHTRDEKYAAAFVEMTTDWIHKHPLEERQRAHPVYEFWKGYAWLDIQTGVRATHICNAFRTLVHAKAFTPDFLRLLLACLYDHQEKTKWLPMGVVHNKAVFEQRGFINIAYHFSEFAESRQWMKIAAGRAAESFLLQTTTDGVQREWSFGYHVGVLRDAEEITERMKAFDIELPQEFLERVGLCYDYIFGVASPDLGAPMFGDAKRPLVDVKRDSRSRWPLYATLEQATQRTGDPKYAARAEGKDTALPDQKSIAWLEAGLYVMRNGWGPESIHMAVHCSPLGISSHDQPDNGTFELYAYGRWLMPDTGFYTYGHDPEGRQWHRQTKVHQTLTLDEGDSEIAGRHLIWNSAANHDALVVENESYAGLIHRRTVWFVERRFFVLLDEAIGDVDGRLDVHFQFAPGEVKSEGDRRLAHTRFDDVNVLVAAAEGSQASIHEEEGWFACEYGHRVPRQAIRFELPLGAPTVFATVIVPYEGTSVPDVRVNMESVTPGDGKVELEVTGFGKVRRIGRDLSNGSTWCEEEA